MKEIELKILNKLNHGTKGLYLLSCRDKVNIYGTSREYLLWNNLIYYRKEGKEHFCFCNWASQTTKSRLNALVREGNFFQRNWIIFYSLNNRLYRIDEAKTYAIDSKEGLLLEYISCDDTYKTVKE